MVRYKSGNELKVTGEDCCLIINLIKYNWVFGNENGTNIEVDMNNELL